MWFGKWWHRWHGRSVTSPRVRKAPARRLRRRPILERLEDRALFAAYSASNVDELITAMESANQTPEADTISLVANTTFTLTQVHNTTNGPTGLPVVAPGENLTIHGNGGVIERGVSSDFRLFSVAIGASLTMDNGKYAKCS